MFVPIDQTRLRDAVDLFKLFVAEQLEERIEDDGGHGIGGAGFIAGAVSR